MENHYEAWGDLSSHLPFDHFLEHADSSVHQELEHSPIFEYGSQRIGDGEDHVPVLDVKRPIRQRFGPFIRVFLPTVRAQSSVASKVYDLQLPAVEALIDHITPRIVLTPDDLLHLFDLHASQTQFVEE